MFESDIESFASSSSLFSAAAAASATAPPPPTSSSSSRTVDSDTYCSNKRNSSQMSSGNLKAQATKFVRFCSGLKFLHLSCTGSPEYCVYFQSWNSKDQIGVVTPSPNVYAPCIQEYDRHFSRFSFVMHEKKMGCLRLTGGQSRRMCSRKRRGQEEWQEDFNGPRRHIRQSLHTIDLETSFILPAYLAWLLVILVGFLEMYGGPGFLLSPDHFSSVACSRERLVGIVANSPFYCLQFLYRFFMYPIYIYTKNMILPLTNYFIF